MRAGSSRATPRAHRPTPWGPLPKFGVLRALVSRELVSDGAELTAGRREEIVGISACVPLFAQELYALSAKRCVDVYDLWVSGAAARCSSSGSGATRSSPAPVLLAGASIGEIVATIANVQASPHGTVRVGRGRRR